MNSIRKLGFIIFAVIIIVSGLFIAPVVFANGNHGSCILTLTKSDSIDPIVLPSDMVTYRLTLKNTGTANCTGGGVKLRDEYDANLTHVSHSVIPANYPSSAAPIIDTVSRFVEFNFATMNPGDVREVDIVFRANVSSCGYTATNKAKYFSDQTGWSLFVAETTTVLCPVVSPPASEAVITATKIVCDAEADLPNWGNGGPDITASTVSVFLAGHPTCRLASGWSFQWGNQNVVDPGDAFIGAVSNGWTTFGSTDSNGITTVAIPLAGITRIWVREVLQQGYIAFGHQTASNVSAEMYCNADVLNYDNYDFINAPVNGSTYYCVAFNVANTVPPACSDGIDNDGDALIDYPNDLGCDSLTDNSENDKPIIILIGQNPMSVFLGSVFINPGATANDTEDGNITTNIVNGGSVNTAVLGSYTLTYNVVDSQNLPAVQKTRTVNVVPVLVVPPIKQCSDGIDNDGDTKIDSQDSGCHTDGDPNNPTTYDPNDDLENTAPVITVLGQNPFSGTDGDAYVDAGAIALDVEDGNITLQIVTSGTIATTTTLSLGSFTVIYSVTDSGGLSDQDSRSLAVQPKNNPPPSCTSNCGGGGGPSIPNLVITNEKVLKIGTTTAIVTWTTNLSATSRVIYEDNSHTTLLGSPNYSYASSTNEDGTLTASHTMTIQGLDLSKAFYFRPISQTTGSSEMLGVEVSLIPTVVQPLPPVVIGSCEYLLEYLRIGQNNNPVEVRKLQVFLRDFEGFNNLLITEVFDQATFDAVSAFQRKYRADVLDPWSLPDSTGYVYYTTKKKVNEIYCAKAFPLTDAQLAEISQFKSVVEGLLQQGVSPAEVIGQGQVGLNQPTISGASSVLASVPIPAVAGTSTVAEASSVIGAASNLTVPKAAKEFSAPVFSKGNDEENNFSSLYASLPETVVDWETISQPIEETETKEEKRGFATLIRAYSFSFADGILISSILLFLFGIWMMVARKRREWKDERKFLGLDE